jgi:hypothetical protein
MKILPRGWRFSSKPGGLDLEKPWWLKKGATRLSLLTFFINFSGND